MERINSNHNGRYHNPPLPPGLCMPPPQLVEKIHPHIYSGFLELLLESGIFDDEFQLSDFEDTTDDDELVEFQVEKSPIPVIDIDGSLISESSSNESRTENRSVSKDSSCSAEERTKSNEQNNNNKHSHGSSNDTSNESTDYRKKRNLKEKSSYSDESDYCEEKRSKKDAGYHPTEEDGFLYGYYHCEICNASMNNEGAYLSHMKGKRHMKTLKQKNISKAIEDSVQIQTPMLSRYSQPPPKMIRKEVKERAKMQKDIFKQVQTPCPGLDRVTEIQGLHEIHYFCNMCKAPCNDGSIISHLKGFPHQTQCLKYFEPETYERLLAAENTRTKLKEKVIECLREIEEKHGCGKITVEKEYSSPKRSHRRRGSKRTFEDVAGPSYSFSDSALPQPAVPDRKRPDFYCSVCDAHMNNHVMWESHIRGRRHITNCKKAPGQAPSKTKAIFMPHERATLMDELSYVRGPIVGLEHIRETQKPEAGGALYNCYLCGACCGSENDAIDHILSQKHRLKYLKEIKHPDLDFLDETSMSESRMCRTVEKICVDVEEEEGRGNIEVYVSKNAGARW